MAGALEVGEDPAALLEQPSRDVTLPEAQREEADGAAEPVDTDEIAVGEDA